MKAIESKKYERPSATSRSCDENEKRKNCETSSREDGVKRTQMRVAQHEKRRLTISG